MTRLNLLPWRADLRKEQDKQLVGLAIFAWVIMAAIVFYGHLHITGLIQNQENRNQFLTDEISKLDKQIAEIRELKKQRNALIARMNIIYQLQGNRTQVVHIFDEIVRQLPEGIYFRRMVQKGAQINIEGTAQSNARVSALMRNFEGSNWFTNPILEVINVKSKGGDRVSEFKLRVIQTDKRGTKDKDSPDKKKAPTKKGPKT